MPFKLSTSQTPTRTIELNADMDLKWVLGGFAPVCPDGYGVSYVQMGEDMCEYRHRAQYVGDITVMCDTKKSC